MYYEKNVFNTNDLYYTEGIKEWATRAHRGVN